MDLRLTPTGVLVAVNGEVDRFVVVVDPRAVRQTNHQTSVLTHAVCGNTANLVAHLRDGSSAVCALVPAMAAGSALQVAQLVGRRHAPQVGPLDELQVECALDNLFDPLDIFKFSITVLTNICISE